MATTKTIKSAKKISSGVKTKAIKEVESTPVNLDSKKIFVIKNPLITEKSYRLSSDGKYVFLVDLKTNKAEIKKAIKTLYKVDAVSVNTVISREKNKHYGPKITPGSRYKKAIVTLKKGQKIDVMPT